MSGALGIRLLLSWGGGSGGARGAGKGVGTLQAGEPHPPGCGPGQAGGPQQSSHLHAHPSCPSPLRPLPGPPPRCISGTRCCLPPPLPPPPSCATPPPPPQIIQQRCEVCGGRGLVPSAGAGRDKYLRKCPQVQQPCSSRTVCPCRGRQQQDTGREAAAVSVACLSQVPGLTVFGPPMQRSCAHAASGTLGASRLAALPPVTVTGTCTE